METFLKWLPASKMQSEKGPLIYPKGIHKCVYTFSLMHTNNNLPTQGLLTSTTRDGVRGPVEGGGGSTDLMLCHGIKGNHYTLRDRDKHISKLREVPRIFFYSLTNPNDWKALYFIQCHLLS
jgi:hypothetical protein